MPFQTYTGIVVSAGKMDKTVKVRIARQKWNRRIQKHYSAPVSHLVHDPNNSCREGDVVSIRSGWRTAKQVRHVVTGIVAPMGEPVSVRPRVPSERERLEEAERKRAAKDVRQAARGRKEAKDRIKVREGEERFRMHVEKMVAQRQARLSLEQMVDVGEELGRAIDMLRREYDGGQVKRLEEAVEELRVVYEEARGEGQKLLREREWMRVILGEESTVGSIITMMREGKWNESEILAEGVDPADYWKANLVRNSILNNAHSCQKQKEDMWEEVAKLLEAETQLAKQRDAAANKLSSEKTLDDDAAAALNAQLQGCHTAIRKIRALDDIKPRELDISKALSGLRDTLDAITLPLTTTSLDLNVPWHTQLQAMRALLPKFTAKSAALQHDIDSSLPQLSETKKALVALAKEHYDAQARHLQSTIEKFEKVEAFVQKYPKVAELPAQFHFVMKKLQVSEPAIDKARDAFARFPKKVRRKGDGEETESRTDVQTMGEAAVAQEAVAAQKEEVEKLESGRKELPPSADLPEGKHRVGPINERALNNKREAMRLEEKAIENEGQARELEKEREAEEKGQVGEEKKGSMFGWFRKS